jgi:hypothetical protein
LAETTTSTLLIAEKSNSLSSQPATVNGGVSQYSGLIETIDIATNVSSTGTNDGNVNLATDTKVGSTINELKNITDISIGSDSLISETTTGSGQFFSMVPVATKAFFTSTISGVDFSSTSALFSSTTTLTTLGAASLDLYTTTQITNAASQITMTSMATSAVGSTSSTLFTPSYSAAETSLQITMSNNVCLCANNGPSYSVIYGVQTASGCLCPQEENLAGRL